MRRGFSLIEAAIVLGIVGLVIGGIWVAASAVQTKHRITGVIETLARAQEQAQALVKTVPAAAEVELNPILSLNALPGGFAPVVWSGTTWLSSGSQHYYFTINTLTDAGRGVYLYTGIVLKGTDPTGNSTWTPQTDLCLALSTRLLDTKLGTKPSGAPSVGWFNNSYSLVGQWNWGTAKPSMASLSTYCASASYIGAYWAL